MPEVLTRPPRDGIDETCARLRGGLGYFGYQWLCACAIFPHLRLPLTIRLGNALARAAGRQAPDEADLLALCRLPWFRKGWIPDELRLRLIGDLAFEFQEPARTVIEHFLFGVTDTSDRQARAAGRQSFKLPPSDWRSIVRTWLSSRDDDGSDALLVRWLHGYGPRSILYNLTRNLRRLFGARLATFLDLKSIVAFLLVAAVAAVIWVNPRELISDAGWWVYFEIAATAKYDSYFGSQITVLKDGTFVLSDGTRIGWGTFVVSDGGRVGIVSDVAIDPYNLQQTRVTLSIRSVNAVTSDASLAIAANNGSAVALLSPGTATAPPLVAQAGQRYPVIPTTLLEAAAPGQPPALPVPPPPPPPVTAARVFTVYFAANSSVIGEQGLALLQQAADAYKAGGVTTVQVTGYTDTSGTPQSSRQISERRAQYVAQVLQRFGVPQSAMTVAGRGSADLAVPTPDGVAEPRNRRVTIVLESGEQAPNQAPAPAPPAAQAPPATQTPTTVPAPPPPPPPARTSKVFIVFFDWDESTITPEGLAVVELAADSYKAGGFTKMQVTGYDDKSGTPQFSQQISVQRAQAVAQALQKLGVPQSAMTVTGRGQNDNRVPTAAGVREPQNRRAEMVLQ